MATPQNSFAQIEVAAVRMATMARMAGVPEDSMRRFLSAGYVPQPKPLTFHAAARECDLPDGPVDVGYGGVRGEAKTHTAFAQVALDDCQRVNDLKFLYLRKVGKSVRESFGDLRKKTLMGVEHNYKSQSGVVEFPPTGSVIFLGHFQNENDIDSYLGLEYDGILVEQAEQLSKSKHRDIRTCRRTSKENWRPRIYYTFNPGGVGHAYMKELLVMPKRRGEETTTRYIFAERGDNVFIDPEYQETLRTLTGWKRKAWYEGDMDIAAGQYFTTWNHDIHVVEPFDVSHLDAWGGFDYGFTHLTTCYPMAMDDGTLLIMGEHAENKKLPPYHAEKIKQMGERLNLNPQWLQKIYAGPDVFANKGDRDGKTIADQYEALGIKLLAANTDRISGAGELLSRLGDLNADPVIQPKIKIFNTCTRLIETIPYLQHDPHRPEDVLKVDADEDGQGGDDPYDGARYGWMRTNKGFFWA